MVHMSEPATLALVRPRAPATDIRLAGRLDIASVERLNRHLAAGHDAGTSPIVVHCDALDTIEPDGALHLWVLCRDRELQTDGHVRLLGLPGRLAARLRRHPLASFLVRGEELFAEPFGASASGR